MYVAFDRNSPRSRNIPHPRDLLPDGHTHRRDDRPLDPNRWVYVLISLITMPA